MSCDEVRDLLAEHLLGTLEEPVDAQIRNHLRGCAACRRDLAALEEGISTFARAAHEAPPPPELQERVLGVLQREWEDAEPAGAPRRVRSWLTWTAAAAVLALSLAWGGMATVRANRLQATAEKYDQFLGVLGGENVRVGKLEPAGPQQIEGSAVVYDSKVEQSWVLVLVRAPGLQGTASVTLSSADGHTIAMHPLEFSDGGEASSWLVTSSNLRPFDAVTIHDAAGRVLATGTVTGE
ncbi:MAG: zf-HC2 domain-containing protein [Candidatus Velamenicoccus archaeovorus]